MFLHTAVRGNTLGQFLKDWKKSSNVARYTFEKNSYDGKNKTSGEVI